MTKIDSICLNTFDFISIKQSFLSLDQNVQQIKYTIEVMNQELAAKGSFGVRKNYYDQDCLWFHGEQVVPSIGVIHKL